MDQNNYGVMTWFKALRKSAQATRDSIRLKYKLPARNFPFWAVTLFFLSFSWSGCAFFNPSGSSGQALPTRLPAYDTKAPQTPLGSLRPKIVIVIDDIGNSKRYRRELASLGDRVTYAILPFRPYSGYFSGMSGSTGAEVILHLPLEARKGNHPGAGVLQSKMTEHEIRSQLLLNIENVPYLVGVNNHMGSLGIQDERLMRLVLSILKERGLFFLDSQTGRRSVSKKIAEEIGMIWLKRDAFLDHVNEESDIRRSLEELKRKAKKQGYAVGIGHYRPKTLKILHEEIPRLEKEGFEIVSLQELARSSGTVGSSSYPL